MSEKGSVYLTLCVMRLVIGSKLRYTEP